MHAHYFPRIAGTDSIPQDSTLCGISLSGTQGVPIPYPLRSGWSGNVDDKCPDCDSLVLMDAVFSVQA